MPASGGGSRTASRQVAPTSPATEIALPYVPNGHEYTIPELKTLAKELRKLLLTTVYNAGSGHPGGSLSAVEIMTALYFGGVLRHDPSNPQWPDRDRFILSKAHVSPILYTILAKAGYFPESELATFRKIDSRLQGHAHIMTPGVEMSGGSLGQGLSFGVGVALTGLLDKKGYRVYVLLGDGECDEGQVWEAAMSAAHYKLHNLTAIVDRNGLQNDRPTSDVMELEPFAAKWRAFGWRVLKVDGHDFEQLFEALHQAQQKRRRPRPTVIIAKTVKGKGVSFMENIPEFHGRAPTKEEYERAMEELA